MLSRVLIANLETFSSEFSPNFSIGHHPSICTTSSEVVFAALNLPLIPLSSTGLDEKAKVFAKTPHTMQ